MAIKYICDRCKAENATADSWRRVSLSMDNNAMNGRYSSINYGDIKLQQLWCSKCLQDTKIDELAKAKAEEPQMTLEDFIRDMVDEAVDRRVDRN